MPTVLPYRRLRHGRPRRLSTPYFLRRRRSPLARLARAVGFFALGGAIGTAVTLAAPSYLEKPLPTVIRGHIDHPLAGIATVVDGDTLRLNGERIRIVGIDAPESGQTCRDASGRAWACGRAATRYMLGLVSRGPVSCRSEGHDRYGRVLAACSAGGVDLGAAMVRNGYAVDYTRYSTRYSAQARAARQERRGLWSGAFEWPEAYRHRRS